MHLGGVLHNVKIVPKSIHSGDFMYPYLKWLATLTKARFRSKLAIEDKSACNFRAGITDIDMFFELNHARYFNYMELGIGLAEQLVRVPVAAALAELNFHRGANCTPGKYHARSLKNKK
jgi:hypothetical protein